MQPKLLMFNKIWTEIFSTPENYEVYWIDLCTTSRIGDKLLQIWKLSFLIFQIVL